MVPNTGKFTVEEHPEDLTLKLQEITQPIPNDETTQSGENGIKHFLKTMATSLDGVTGTRFPSLCASVKYLEN